MAQDTPLTAKSSISDWLEHPVGGALLRDMLAQGGQDERALAPVRSFSLDRLVSMSGGQLSQDTVDDLVLRANGGVAPTEDPAAASADAASWAERIVPDRFAGRTAVVTGAGSGIGRATASRIAREGGRVIAVDVSEPRLADLADSLAGTDLITVAADITDAAGVQRIVDAAGARIDCLANVAGIMDDMSPAHEVTEELWDRVFAVNVRAMFTLTKAVIPRMLAAGSGSVVNVSSEAGLRGSAAGAAYTSAKHAVIGLTRSCAFMYASDGIRVNAVAPGPVLTNIGGGGTQGTYQARIMASMAVMPPIANPDQLAASITFLLSDDGTNLNGAVLPSDGGWSVT